MEDKLKKVDQIIDGISWAGLVLLWVMAAFIRFVQSHKPGAIGVIGSSDGPTAIFFAYPILQMTPAIAGTLLFIILTILLRISPTSIGGRICRYLRFAVVIAGCLLTVVSIV